MPYDEYSPFAPLPRYEAQRPVILAGVLSGYGHWSREDPTLPFPDPDWERPLSANEWPGLEEPGRLSAQALGDLVPPETSGGRFSGVPLNQPIFDMDGNADPYNTEGARVRLPYTEPRKVVSLGGCTDCRSGLSPLQPAWNWGLLAVAAAGIGLTWLVLRR